jgi:hypothetical protein
MSQAVLRWKARERRACRHAGPGRPSASVLLSPDGPLRRVPHLHHPNHALSHHWLANSPLNLYNWFVNLAHLPHALCGRTSHPPPHSPAACPGSCSRSPTCPPASVPTSTQAEARPVGPPNHPTCACSSSLPTSLISSSLSRTSRRMSPHWFSSPMMVASYARPFSCQSAGRRQQP